MIMTESGLISVIVPVYKVEAYLDECIESIINQTYSNLEIILVDDGSPDNCPEMCDEWSKKDNRIKVIHKANGGLSDARNAGMRIATGEFLTFLDSDDWIDEQYYEVLIDEMVKNDCDIVSGGFTMVFSRDSQKQITKDKNTVVLNTTEAMVSLIDETIIKQVVWNKIYKHSLVGDILFEVGKCHEDVFWSYQAIGKAQKIAVVDYDGLYYYQRPDSIMGTDFSIKRLDAVEARANRQSYLEEYFPDLADKGRVNLNFSCMYFAQQALKSMNRTESKEIVNILNKYISKHVVSFKLAKAQGIVQMIWLLSAKCSLNITCRIRNLFKIGL